MECGLAFEQLKLLTWKNALLLNRKPINTLCLLFIPLLFPSFFLYINSNVGPASNGTTVVYPSSEITSKLDIFLLAYKNISLAYAPNNSKTRKIAERTASFLKENMQIYGFENEQDLSDEVWATDSILGGIVFLNESFEDDDLSHNITYKIRLQDSESAYYRGRFLPIQRAVDSSIIAELGGNVSSMRTFVKMFPAVIPRLQPKVLTSELFISITFGFLVLASAICKEVVEEKEKKIKEYMKLLGLKGWVNWFAWFIKYVAITAVIVSLTCVIFHSKSGSMLYYTHQTITFTFTFLYALASIVFCFAITTLFNKAKTAAFVGVTVFSLTYFTSTYLDEMDISYFFLCSLLPNMAVSFGCKIISKYEGLGIGVQWSNLCQVSSSANEFSMFHVFLMLCVDIVVYAAITWYIDAIRPGEFGTPQPLYFPFQKNYWCGHSKNSEQELLYSESPDYGSRSEFFEPNPPNCQVGIRIRDLTKVFSKNSKPAVNNLSLDICEGHIVALLGHNGAGKTTAMSMLTGFIPPTKGTAFINNFNIRYDLSEVRHNLGFCPQASILFDNLTVTEHLKFFAKLKGCSEADAQSEVPGMVNALSLDDKENVLITKLSGGMQRKLSIGIALIGGSKFVILDEPSSGLDPEARRQIWDVLKAHQQGRTMILSTHYMDEADYLGDKIAIMAEGVIQCFGTSLFLKKKYGVGYQLTMVKTEGSDLSKINELIESKVADSVMTGLAGAEVKYLLPKVNISAFSSLFVELETAGEEMGILDFGVSLTTLEEVFIRVGELAGSATDEDKAITDEHLNRSNTKSYDLILPDMTDSSDNVHEEGLSRTLLLLHAMLHKKFLITWRSRLLSLAQIFPAVFVSIFAYYVYRAMHHINEQPASPPSNLDIARYSDLVTIYATTRNAILSPWLIECYKETLMNINGIHVYLNDRMDYHNETDMDRYLLQVQMNESHDHHSKYRLATEIGPDYMLGFCDDIGISISLMDNVWLCGLLRYKKSPLNYKITTINHPLTPWPRTFYVNTDARLLGAFIGLIVNFGFSTLTASFVIFLIKERTSGAKRSQYISGATSGTFWLSTFIWDCFNYLIPTVIVLIIFCSFQIEGYTSGSNLWFLLMNFLAYGWSSLPLVYTLSFVFSDGTSAFNWISTLNIIIGVITIITVTIFKFPHLDLLHIADPLEWIFYILLSNFCFVRAFQNLLANYENGKACYPDGCKGPYLKYQDNYLSWEDPGIGKPIAFMIIQGFVLFLLLLLVECDVINDVRNRCLPRVLLVRESPQQIDLEPLQAEDSDVHDERVKVLNTEVSELTSGKNVLVLKNLTKRYSRKVLATNSLCLQIPSGECFGLLGVNGAGKTSTFKMMIGEETITRGEIYIKGINVAQHLARTRQYVGYCPQFDTHIDQMTVRETLLMHIRLRGIKRHRIQAVFNKMVEKFMLSKHVNKQTAELSGGNKRKLSVAIASIGHPQLIFLDEPSTGIDPVARRDLWNFLGVMREIGSTIVLTSHSMEECEALCTRLAIMVNGEFKCLGTGQHLKSKFGAEYSITLKMSQTQDQMQDQMQNQMQDQMQNQMQDISFRAKDFMARNFPGSILVADGNGLLSYRIAKSIPGATLANIFGLLESSKEALNIDDYSVGQANLEQIFINFARGQRETQQDD